MAYNRKNLLTKVVEIQEITLEHTRRGVNQEWIYFHLIFPQYRISKRTYYNYLGTAAKAELKRLNEQPKQGVLF
ncbi:hypothetical protein CLV25_11551 [Acetobacteroides hydrogenigenes]|uniref:Uncharacterized protein n=1 Tax=Acetobacteroides hydrogenigenes TaxID=979970 RepID=A0A4R2E6Y2_9BACT|nr:hypothetical protein CLV25_11551 [Acetobacteroides hydrogenigenes]